MDKILELRAKRAKAWDTAKAFLDSKRSESGLLSAEDTATYEKMEADVVALGKEIERLERQSALDLEMAKPTSAPILNNPANGIDNGKTGRASDEYKTAFGNLLRGKPVITNVMQTGIDADGGFLVPTEFEDQIIKTLEDVNVIRGLAKTIRTSAERKIPVAANHSVARWTAENASVTESNPTFAQKTLDAYKLTDLIKVSIELMQDSMFDLEGYIAEEIARAFGAAEEESFCIGTGGNQPTGIFTANGGSLGVTAGSPTAITTDNLLDLVYSLGSAYRKNAGFLMKDSTVCTLRKLKDNTGQYLWSPSTMAGQPDLLLGYPIHTSPYVPTPAAGAFSVAFGDFSSYWIADRMGRTVQRLNELYAGNGQIGFIATQRLDASVIVPEGIKLLKMSGGA